MANPGEPVVPFMSITAIFTGVVDAYDPRVNVTADNGDRLTLCDVIRDGHPDRYHVNVADLLRLKKEPAVFGLANRAIPHDKDSWCSGRNYGVTQLVLAR